MIEYNKIDTLYKRDMEGTKKLLEGEFRNPAVEFLKDNIWQFTEKVDGTNIRVYWDGHKVQFGGRTERAQIPANLVNYLNNTFGTSEAEQIFEEKFGETEVILFGEGYGPKIHSPSITTSGGKITAAATTEPQSGPRPASSHPQTIA